jgi:hypothetical protein
MTEWEARVAFTTSCEAPLVCEISSLGEEVLHTLPLKKFTYRTLDLHTAPMNEQLASRK